MSRTIIYNEIKEYFFYDCYSYCISKFHGKKINKWSSLEDGLGNSLDEEQFDSPVQYLMAYVIYIILNAGRHYYSHEFYLKEIDEILSKYSIEDLTENLDKEEKEEFLHDLNLVLENRELESLKNSFEYKW